MAAPKGQESMSALGSLYDLLFTVAEDTSKRKGPNAVPDLVPYQISDGVAEGIMGLGSTLAGVASAEGTSKVIDSFVLRNLFDANTIAENVEYKNMFGSGGTRMEFRVDGDSNATMTGETEAMQMERGTTRGVIFPTKGIDVELSSASVNSLLINPAGFANSFVEEWWKKHKLEENARLIAALIDNRAIEVPAKLAQAAGLDSADVRVASEYLTNRALKVDKDVAAAVAVVQQAAAPDVSTAPQLYVKNNRLGAAVDASVSMFAGITDEKQREAFTKAYSEKAKADILAQYNAMSASITGFTPLRDFNELFTAANRGTALHAMSSSALFNTSFGPGIQVGDVMQSAMRTSFTNLSTDMTLPADVRANFARLATQVNDQAKFGSFIQNMSSAVDPGKRDARALIRQGVTELSEKYKAAGNKFKAAVLNRAERGIATEQKWEKFSSWRASIANDAAYGYSRWKTMPAINKIVTPLGLLTGSTFLDLADWGGGLLGYGKSLGMVTTAFGIDSNKVWGSYGNSFKTFILSHRANGFQKWAYNMQNWTPLGATWGLMNGDYFQRMLWAGSGFGKNVNDKSKWSTSGKFAYNMLKGEKWYSKAYLGMTRTVGRVRFIFNLPQMLINKSLIQLEKLRAAMAKKAADAAAAAFRKVLGQKLADWLIGVFGALTGGIINAIQFAYKALNFLSFGLLDKGLEFALKLMMQIFIGVVMGLFVVFPIIGGHLASGGTQEVTDSLGSGGLRAPAAGWNPYLFEYDDPTSNSGDPGDKGYTGVDPGTNPVYSGSCQQIFAKVKAEYPFAEDASDASLSTPSDGSPWCNAFDSPVVSCRFSEIDPFCRDHPGDATRLFRHELTHVVCPLSEFCAEVNGDNGGGYDFAAPAVMGDNKRYLATQIASKIATKYGVEYSVIKDACWCKSTAVAIIRSKGINMPVINATQGRR